MVEFSWEDYAVTWSQHTTVAESYESNGTKEKHDQQYGFAVEKWSESGI